MPDHAFQVSTPTVAPRPSAQTGSLPAPGLPKSEPFGPAIDRQLAVCRRSSTSLAVIVIGLDGFESIEPQYRHAIENQLLYAVWNRLRGHLRSTDLALRLGATEFGVILPDAAGPTAAIVDTRLIDALSRPYGLGALQIVISARAGVAVYPQSAATGEALAAAARQVMLTRATRRQPK